MVCSVIHLLVVSSFRSPDLDRDIDNPLRSTATLERERLHRVCTDGPLAINNIYAREVGQHQ